MKKTKNNYQNMTVKAAAMHISPELYSRQGIQFATLPESVVIKQNYKPNE